MKPRDAGEALRWEWADLLADSGWRPVVSAPYAVRGETPIGEFWPVGSARELDLGRRRFFIGVRTSQDKVTLSGRRVPIGDLHRFPSRPCINDHAKENA